MIGPKQTCPMHLTYIYIYIRHIQIWSRSNSLYQVRGAKSNSLKERRMVSPGPSCSAIYISLMFVPSSNATEMDTPAPLRKAITYYYLQWALQHKQLRFERYQINNKWVVCSTECAAQYDTVQYGTVQVSEDCQLYHKGLRWIFQIPLS